MRSVLIVEDDDDLRSALTEFLVEEGYEVRSAPNGAVALAALEHEAPAVILLDLVMPVMDGMGFRKKQLADPRLAQIPLLVMSADETVALVTPELKAWAQLPKPIHLEFLLELLKGLCNESKPLPMPAPDSGRAGRRVAAGREPRAARSQR